MERLIDADEFVKTLEMTSADVCADFGDGFAEFGYSRSLIRLLLSEAPTVDAVEVVHGRWIQDKQSKFEHRYNCSACNYRLIDEPCNYCPNCGAKMDLDEV